MSDLAHGVDEVAGRLAALLTGRADGVEAGIADAEGSDLVFQTSLELRPLVRTSGPPPEVWAVDGGQSLVADARVVTVYATRAARVRWTPSGGSEEEVGPLQVHLLGLGQEGVARSALRAPVAAGCTIDVNLLRDWAEWSAARRCVEEAAPGAVVLLDGDLEPDWRVSPEWVAELLELASDRSVTVAGVTKHTSLAWEGAPLAGTVERMAAASLGPRAMWWVPVAERRPSSGPGVSVVMARLDPDARFSFRVDLAGDSDAASALGAISAVSDDAAFPGYPWPLSVADRLAACPPGVRGEVWDLIEERLTAAGVPLETSERAFADRHRLMERY